jgi:predicted component of type VI protein secretion system
VWQAARETHKTHSNAVLSGLVLCVLLGSCRYHRDLPALGRLRARIHAELGSDASVNVHTAQGSTTVTIRLTPLPAKDSKRVQEQVEAFTRAEFPGTDYVVVLSRP